MARTRRTLIGVVTAVAVLGSAGLVGWWFFLRDDVPPPADIDTASETLDAAAAGDAATSDLLGDWSVDAAVGSFEDFSGTWAGYRVDEELAGIGAATAVGRTPQVTGTMTVREDQVTAVGVEVDLTTLQSDQGWRDQTLRLEGLQSNQYPTARFTLTEPLDLPDTIQDRERAAVNAAGDLTLHGTTKQVAVDLEVELTGDRAVVVGSSSISLADFGIEVPTSVRVLSVADEGAFEFQIFFSRT